MKLLNLLSICLISIQGYAAEYEISKILSLENEVHPVSDVIAMNEEGQILESDYELGILIDADREITHLDEQFVDSFKRRFLFKRDLDEAYKKAEKNYPNAQFFLGFCYEHGIDVRKDIDQAISWYKKSAKQDHKWAQYQLGNIYYYQVKDNLKARQMFEKAAEQDLVPAQSSLGVMHFHGHGGPKDNYQAAFWLEKAAAKEFPEALFYLGRLYRGSYNHLKDGEEITCTLFRKAADKGHIEAQRWISHIIRFSEEDQAIEFYERAIEKGDVLSKLELSRLLYYKDSQSIDKDRSEVLAQEAEKEQANEEIDIDMYEKLDEKGNRWAPFKLGLLYFNAHEYERAYAWFDKAESLGVIKAKFYIGLMYQQEKGFRQDNSVAKMWFKEAAELGDRDAMVYMGLFSPSYSDESFEWYEKAAKKGQSEAMLKLSRLYFSPKDGEVCRDVDQGWYWLERSAEYGNSEGQREAAYSYLTYRWHEYNGIYWLLKAAEQKNASAISVLHTEFVRKYY